MTKKFDNFQLDIRALKLNISRGNITKKDYEDYLKKLPDLVGQAKEIPAYFEEEEDLLDTETVNENDDLTFSVA